MLGIKFCGQRFNDTIRILSINMPYRGRSYILQENPQSCMRKARPEMQTIDLRLSKYGPASQQYAFRGTVGVFLMTLSQWARRQLGYWPSSRVTSLFTSAAMGVLRVARTCCQVNVTTVPRNAVRHQNVT